MSDSRPAAGSDDAERREAYYSGHVQGVGFRYTVSRLAEGCDVRGFVRNLPDGRVHLVAEGRRGDLTNFLAAIAERMSHYIRQVAVDVRPANGEFIDFEVRH